MTARQEEIYIFIKNFIRDHRFSPTVREIALFFDFSHNAAHSHVKNLASKGKIRYIPRLSRSIVILEDSASIDELIEIEVLGAIAAGTPIFSEENRDGQIRIPSSLLRIRASNRENKFFALRVQGSSMKDAGILDGDLVVILHQNWANNGTIVVAKTSEGGVTLKRFFKEGNRFRLEAENPDYQPIYTNDIQILGKLKLVLRDY